MKSMRVGGLLLKPMSWWLEVLDESAFSAGKFPKYQRGPRRVTCRLDQQQNVKLLDVSIVAWTAYADDYPKEECSQIVSAPG